MTGSLETLATRFFAMVGLVEPAGYRTVEVLLEETAQRHFGGQEHLVLAFSPEAARERADSELLTFGSPLLDVMAQAASSRWGNVHLYLNAVQPTTGRTLDKVRAQSRVPGLVLRAGQEQLMMFHHALFRFRVSLIGEEREELFRDVAVDLHTGWATLRLQEQALRLNGSTEPAFAREITLRLSLWQACQAAMGKLSADMAPRIEVRQDQLMGSCRVEQQRVAEHYDALIARLDAGRARKGADPARIDDKVRATRSDQRLRLEDLEKRYHLTVETVPTQLALVSYLKASVPLELKQGKEFKPGMAVWDSVTQEGYFVTLA